MHRAAWLLVLMALWAVSPATALESPNRSPLVVPAGDCPSLPKVFREIRRFDTLIRRAVSKHWPAPLERNWCWWKAQLAAESGLKPRATSPVGAKGIAQFMDPALSDVARRLARKLNPYDARDGIEAGAIYVINLRRQWTSPRPEQEAFRLAWASYNAGLGSVLCGQRKADGALLWRGIAPALHQCTGRHADETRGYVTRISRFTGFRPDPAPANDDVPVPVLRSAVCE